MRQLCVECTSGSSVQNSHSSPCLHAAVSLVASTGINTTFFRKVAKDWSYFRHRCVQWGGQSHWSEAPCDSSGSVWPAIKCMGQGLEAGRKVGRKEEGGFSASASGSGEGEEEGGWPGGWSPQWGPVLATGHGLWVHPGHPCMCNPLLWFPEKSVKNCLPSAPLPAAAAFYDCHYYYFAISLLRQILSPLQLAVSQSWITLRVKSTGLWTSAQISGAPLPADSLSEFSTFLSLGHQYAKGGIWPVPQVAVKRYTLWADGARRSDDWTVLSLCV